ncbi:MAG: hypothetical protein HY907_12370 [Deltaproteobacteria bacterium]|nr:hypothetical protein [Deltaproteobacteria bacterium]
MHIRDLVPESQVRAFLAQLMDLPAEAVVRVEDVTAAEQVRYRCFPRSKGFRTSVSVVLVGRAPVGWPRTDLELGKAVARFFSQDVVVDPADGDPNPFRWLLVRPDGSEFPVSEIPPEDDEDEDGIVIVEPPVES